MSYIVREGRPGEAAYVTNLHLRLYSEEYECGPAFITERFSDRMAQNIVSQ